MTLRGPAALSLLLLLLTAAAGLAAAQPPPDSAPASMAVSTAVGRKSSPPMTSTAAVATSDLQDIPVWDEEDAVAELGDVVDIDEVDEENQLQRRVAPEPEKRAKGGAGCQLLTASRGVRRRMSPTELRRLLRQLMKEHHAFHLPGKRGGVSRRLCRYGKRGQWRPCSVHYPRLRSRRPYAYHWPIMNILGGALG